jgi:branched-chain amino acid transport system ATP-binding protein
MSALLEVHGLEAFYGARRVLHGLDLSVAERAVAALLGANGAGKTTLLRAISGLIRRRGTVRFGGEDITAWPAHRIARAGIAHVPEGRGTFVELSVEENLRLGAISRRGGASAEALERVLGYFPRLRERWRQQAGTLSGGEQQMLAIARALLLRPRLMLLDEPSFGLAPRLVSELFAILARINAEEGVALLLVEQNADRALELASHAYLLETGRVVLATAPEAMRADAAIRRAYLGY